MQPRPANARLSFGLGPSPLSFLLSPEMLGHGKLSAWYHQLAQQLEAGLPFAGALRSSRDGAYLPAAASGTLIAWR